MSVKCEDPAEPVLKNNLTGYNNSLMGIVNSGHKHYETYELWDVKKKLDHQELKFFAARLVHGMKYRMEERNEDYFIDIAKCGNFTIKWSIMDSNLIDSVKGELHVVVE